MFKQTFLFALTLSLCAVNYTSHPAQAKEVLRPQSQVQRGMKGECRTVFQGTKIEPFAFEILGNMKGMLGPGLDVYLAQISGPKAEYTGVVSGMSGSPCYIDGQLIGALSYRFGSFTKVPIAGITPIQDMLKLFSIPEQPALPAQQVYRPADTAEMPQNPLLASGQVQFQGRSLDFQPIATPITISGISPTVFAAYQPQLQKMGFHAVMGSSGGWKGHPEAPDKLEMGGAIAGQMVRGDISISGTGTVSYVDGDKVLAFGHPFFGAGNVRMPMATAYVHHILVSEMGSYKMAEDGREVGTITHDRLTAIAGTNGLHTRMIPVQINIQDRAGVDLNQINFEVFQDPSYTPMLLAMGIQNSLSDRLQFNLGGNIKASGIAKVDGRELPLTGYYSTTPTQSAAQLAAQSVARKLFQVWANPFQSPHIEKITLNYQLAPQTQIAQIDAIWADRSEVKPGESVGVHVRLKTYRNETLVRHLRVQVPEDAAYGPMTLLASDAASLQQLEAGIKTGYVSYAELLSDLAVEREPQRLYLKWIAESPGITIDSQLYAKMPPSVIEQLDNAANLSSTVPLMRSPGTEYSVPVAYDLQGQQAVRVFVTPVGRVIN